MITTNKIIYVAGAYTADSEDGVFENIMQARESAKWIWKLGGIAICPHLNTMFFGGIVKDSRFYSADLEILFRCDAMYLMEGWQGSKGSIGEKKFADNNNIPVFKTFEDLAIFLSKDRGVTQLQIARPAKEKDQVKI